MLKEIDKELGSLLRTVRDLDDIRICQKWGKVLSTSLIKSLKMTDNMSDGELIVLHSTYQTLLVCVDNLIALLNNEDEAEIYYGSSSYDVLVKARCAIVDYQDKFAPKESKFTLDKEQEKTLIALQGL